MQHLYIKNFLVIKEAKLEIKRINILIGEQATDKSIIAKLLYFFQDFLSSTFTNSLVNVENQRTLKKSAIDNFKKLISSIYMSKTRIYNCL